MNAFWSQRTGLNRCGRHNFNVIDTFHTSMFGILWHRRSIWVHWWCADAMIWLRWLHWRREAIGSRMIWSWMMCECRWWSSGWYWRWDYRADCGIFTRLATIRWCGRCWCSSWLRFRRCIETEYTLQWTLSPNRNRQKRKKDEVN